VDWIGLDRTESVASPSLFVSPCAVLCCAVPHYTPKAADWTRPFSGRTFRGATNQQSKRKEKDVRITVQGSKTECSVPVAWWFFCVIARNYIRDGRSGNHNNSDGLRTRTHLFLSFHYLVLTCERGRTLVVCSSFFWDRVATHSQRKTTQS